MRCDLLRQLQVFYQYKWINVAPSQDVHMLGERRRECMLYEGFHRQGAWSPVMLRAHPASGKWQSVYSQTISSALSCQIHHFRREINRDAT